MNVNMSAQANPKFKSKSPSPEDSNGSVPIIDKVTKYEHFLNEVLRTDLKTTLEQREELYNEIAQYLELQTILEKLSTVMPSPDSRLKTRVDIGSNFYLQAVIPSISTITVDIGCGIWLPMSIPSAEKFCNKKLSVLRAQVEDLTQKELSIKAQIKIVLEGLREIQNF